MKRWRRGVEGGREIKQVNKQMRKWYRIIFGMLWLVLAKNISNDFMHFALLSSLLEFGLQVFLSAELS